MCWGLTVTLAACAGNMMTIIYFCLTRWTTNNYIKVKPSQPCDPVACRMTFSSSNFLHDSISLWYCCLFMHSSLKIPQQQHFSLGSDLWLDNYGTLIIFFLVLLITLIHERLSHKHESWIPRYTEEFMVNTLTLVLSVQRTFFHMSCGLVRCDFTNLRHTTTFF